ncbi:hypothetical protein FIBSPDRAFT_901392 [Athelia psychrophila]|uniref:Uncharacterized protein n=1 Tax=Athelia psychrophila TaxID=1759441 RepID=A0A165X654_9AGAM|nr:hypothetical protein FIBSPDRAFT_901392 [Fibularhizoctonia sp. CBS 109695]
MSCSTTLARSKFTHILPPPNPQKSYYSTTLACSNFTWLSPLNIQFDPQKVSTIPTSMFNTAMCFTFAVKRATTLIKLPTKYTLLREFEPANRLTDRQHLIVLQTQNVTLRLRIAQLEAQLSYNLGLLYYFPVHDQPHGPVVPGQMAKWPDWRVYAPQVQGDPHLYGPNNASGSATNDYNMNFDDGWQPHQPGYYHQNYQQAGGNSQSLPSQEEHIQEEEEEEEEEPQQWRQY